MAIDRPAVTQAPEQDIHAWDLHVQDIHAIVQDIQRRVKSVSGGEGLPADKAFYDWLSGVED